MIKLFEGVLKLAPYEGRKAVFLKYYPQPIFKDIDDEIQIHGPLKRIQIMTTPTLESPIYFLKEEDYQPPTKIKYVSLIKKLRDYAGQQCKILIETTH
jgi:hypothetical protein